MSASSILATIASQYDAYVSRSDFLTLAASRVNSSVFGTQYDYAVALIAAHMLAMFTSSARASGEAGAVSSMRQGDLSIAFAVSADSSGDYNQTSYGRQFLQLRKEVIIPIGLTGVSNYEQWPTG